MTGDQQQQLSPSRWRKRPVEIEAMQWAGTMQSASAIYSWAREHGVRMGPVEDPEHETCILIPTLEGDMRAAPDDWIIRGVAGEFYPCKPDIFAATYDAVAEHGLQPPVLERDCKAESPATMPDSGDAVTVSEERFVTNSGSDALQTADPIGPEGRFHDSERGTPPLVTEAPDALPSDTPEDGLGERGHRPPPPPPHKPPPNRYYP